MSASSRVQATYGGGDAVASRSGAGSGAASRAPSGAASGAPAGATGGARAGADSGPETSARFRAAVEGLIGAIDEGAAYLPGDAVSRAKAVLARGAERLSLSGAHTVVALAGATGSGKSSLFNRLVGEEMSTVGMLRPTTSSVTAAVWGHDDAGQLLSWLQAPARHHIEPSRRAKPDEQLNLDGLVLLDLPDVDSHSAAHRAEADRILALCDVFVWVTDPQKYADSVLHDEYLRHARHHQKVTLVVLNQADRMRSDQAKACRDDLRRLLTQDGLPEAEVLLTSARTGLGLEELALALGSAAQAATAARSRLHADLVRQAEVLREHVADSEVSLPTSPDANLVEALENAAAVPTVLRSVHADYRRRAGAQTGWVFTRPLAALRKDPLRAIGLTAVLGGPARAASMPSTSRWESLRSFGRSAAEVDPAVAAVQRSSLPTASPVSRAAVALATRRLADGAAAGLPRLWADAVYDAATPDQDRLSDALDQAIVATPLRRRAPLWWGLFEAFQWLFALGAFAGLAWLTVLGVLGWMQLPVPETPMLGIVPLPTMMLVLGLLGGPLLAVLARPLVLVGARRRTEKVRGELRERITAVATTQLIEPVAAVLARHRGTRQHLSSVLGR